MSKFRRRPSRAYASAVDALHTLLTSEGAQSVDRAYAEIAHGVRKKAFTQAPGVKMSKRTYPQCLAPLLGRRHVLGAPDGMCELCDPLRAEHYALLQKNRKPVCFVMQPYKVSWEDMKKLVEFCDNYSFRASVSAQKSWHFPGWTLGIFIKGT